MKEIRIRSNEAGQRLDKFLHKYLKEAGSGFLFKMMRKKNITLNGKKCEGKEKLAEGDCIQLFLADETIEKFRGQVLGSEGQSDKKDEVKRSAGSASPSKEKGIPDILREYKNAFHKIGNLEIIYEDRHILAVNKPAGILTQKANPGDYSLNEWLIGYLLARKEISPEELNTFRPSVCNRLDRNTSGLVLCGKSLAGTQMLSGLLRDRSVHKYYRLFVKGRLEEEKLLQSWLIKDKKTNQVMIFNTKPQSRIDKKQKVEEIKTGIRPLAWLEDCTYVEAELFTGKTHQIRAHLASIGHPLLGDAKYGDPSFNRKYAGMGVKSQLLHAYRVEFPEKMATPFEALSGKILTAKEPEIFRRLQD